MGGIYEKDLISKMQSVLLLAKEITVQINYFALYTEGKRCVS